METWRLIVRGFKTALSKTWWRHLLLNIALDWVFTAVTLKKQMKPSFILRDEHRPWLRRFSREPFQTVSDRLTSHRYSRCFTSIKILSSSCFLKCFPRRQLSRVFSYPALTTGWAKGWLRWSKVKRHKLKILTRIVAKKVKQLTKDAISYLKKCPPLLKSTSM